MILVEFQSQTCRTSISILLKKVCDYVVLVIHIMHVVSAAFSKVIETDPFRNLFGWTLVLFYWKVFNSGKVL